MKSQYRPSKKVLRAATKLANQRMRVEVLPRLSIRHPRPNSWNPLRADFNGPSDYGMKLWMPDALVLEILRNNALLDLTAEIVVDAVTSAAVSSEPRDFVTSIFDYLISDDSA